MFSFTEYWRLREFSKTADGDFGYLWYGKYFVEELHIINGARVWVCASVK